jgi:hypothetical protein
MQETQVNASQNGHGVGEAAKEVFEQGTKVAELAAEDLKKQLRALALGALYGLGAALLSVFAVGLVLATIAVALATFLAWWLSMVIVTGAVLFATLTLALLAKRQFTRGAPALPRHLRRGVERERLIEAFANFRHELGNTAKARAKGPAATAAAGFVIGGGLKAAAKLAFRKRR